VTLGKLFKSQGYATGIVGKWHLGSSEQSWPTRQGFDEYRVGVIETTDGTLYRDGMQRAGMPDAAITAAEPYIWESEADGKLKKVRSYTVDYRRQIEGDIATASVDFIERQARAQQPFFLYVGWTHTHYPTVVGPEFAGKSRIGPYGDAIMELDHRTGQVLDALKAADVGSVRLAPRFQWPVPRRARRCAGRLDPHRRHDQVAGQDRAAGQQRDGVRP